MDRRSDARKRNFRGRGCHSNGNAKIGRKGGWKKYRFVYILVCPELRPKISILECLVFKLSFLRSLSSPSLSLFLSLSPFACIRLLVYFWFFIFLFNFILSISLLKINRFWFLPMVLTASASWPYARRLASNTTSLWLRKICQFRLIWLKRNWKTWTTRIRFTSETSYKVT